MAGRLGDSTYRRMLPFAALLVLWNILCWQFPFFWDNILNSRIAQWYLDDHFSSLVVPESMDAGHPPFFSLYLALAWSVFGKSLAVAHAAMLPFLLGVQWLSWRIGKHLLPEKALPWTALILFVEPTLLAQTAQVTPDIALLFFYLLAMIALLSGRRMVLALALVGMGMMSFRGVLAFGAVGVVDLVLGRMDGQKLFDGRRWWPYLLAGGMAAVWLLYHRQQAGWMLSPPESTYGGHRKLGDASLFLRNAAIVAWRLLDDGRLFGWIGVIGGLTYALRKGTLTPHNKQLIALTVIPVLCLSLLFIPFTNPIGHRYFMPTYFFLAMTFLGLIADHWNSLRRRILGLVLLAGWVGGHAWVYPDEIAKGWDASLAHLPYHAHRSAAVQFIQDQDIPRHDVCTDFPALAAESFLDPTHPDTTRFSPLPPVLDSVRFVLYSNVCNGFSDEMLDELKDESKWIPRFRSGVWPVRVVIFEHIQH